MFTCSVSNLVFRKLFQPVIFVGGHNVQSSIYWASSLTSQNKLMTKGDLKLYESQLKRLLRPVRFCCEKLKTFRSVQCRGKHTHVRLSCLHHQIAVIVAWPTPATTSGHRPPPPPRANGLITWWYCLAVSLYTKQTNKRKHTRCLTYILMFSSKREVREGACMSACSGAVRQTCT